MSYQTTSIPSNMSKPDLISFDVVREVDEILKRELLESKRKHNHWLAMSEMRENLEAPLQVQTYKF